MQFMGKNYGEDQGLVIDRLTMLGWVSSGTRRASEKLASKDGTMAMLCLGNDVILTIRPKWEAPGPEEWEWGHVQGPIGLLAGRDGAAGTHEGVVVPAGKNGRGEGGRTEMSVTLVHGDMVLFSGCDFEVRGGLPYSLAHAEGWWMDAVQHQAAGNVAT